MSLVAVKDVTKTYRLGTQEVIALGGVSIAVQPRQRVAIARALVTDPLLVLADEPTANLDSKTGTEVVALMRRLNREHGTTFVFSTHDPRIMSAADRVIEISDGRLR